MIKQNWEINEYERKRILFLHETALKKHYLIFEQTETKTKESNSNIPAPLNFNLKDTFESGKSQLTKINEINDIIKQINTYISKYGKAFKVTVEIESSESKVSQEEGTGSLSKARLYTLENYLKGKIPDNIKIVKKDMGAQGPEWPYTASTKPNGEKVKDKITKHDPMYTEVQYVKLKVESEFDICKLQATEADGSVGQYPTFISFDKTYNVGNSSNLILNIKFDCKTIPDFIRIYYGGKIVGQGWVGLKMNIFKVLIGLFGQNFSKNEGIRINIPYSNDISEEKAAGYLNNYEGGAKSFLINMFPNAEYGDEIGARFFEYNKNIKPAISDMEIYPNGKIFPVQLVEGTTDLRIQIFSPFGGTVWSFSTFCSE